MLIQIKLQNYTDRNLSKTVFGSFNVIHGVVFTYHKEKMSDENDKGAKVFGKTKFGNL